MLFRSVLFASFIIAAEDLQWGWRQPEELRQTLRHAKVNKTERAAIVKAIAYQIKLEMPDVDSGQQLEDMALNTRVKLVDLNGDGTSEVIAQGAGLDACSPTGNCSFWVFQKSHSSFRLLFSGGAFQTFQIQRSKSNGFRDIVVEMHGSATESTLRLLRYSEGKYHEEGCYDANWSVLEGDVVRDLKEPRVTPCGEGR